jgi:hypothetical protein
VRSTINVWKPFYNYVLKPIYNYVVKPILDNVLKPFYNRVVKPFLNTVAPLYNAVKRGAVDWGKQRLSEAQRAYEVAKKVTYKAKQAAACAAKQSPLTSPKQRSNRCSPG